MFGWGSAERHTKKHTKTAWEVVVSIYSLQPATRSNYQNYLVLSSVEVAGEAEARSLADSLT